MELASSTSLPFFAHQLQVFPFGLAEPGFHSRTLTCETQRAACPGGLPCFGGSNHSLNSDPAFIVFRSLSSFRFLGSAQRLGAGGAG